jgi:hypothetical protein
MSVGTKVQLTPEQQAMLVKIDEASKMVMVELVKLDMDYEERKHQLRQKLHRAQTEFQNTLTVAARSSGVDDDKARWDFDFRSMTLTRQPENPSILNANGAPV